MQMGNSVPNDGTQVSSPLVRALTKNSYLTCRWQMG